MVDLSCHFRLPVAPLLMGEPRPLWSVMIPTYNCGTYLAETLGSVLAQDPGPVDMQIEVVDDHSTLDDPEEVVKRMGRGRVEFYRQPEHVGHVHNFQTCLEHSRGHLIHLLHGDDLVRDGFYSKMRQAFEEHPGIGGAFCRHLSMDEQGHWIYVSPLERSEPGILYNWLEQISSQQRIQYAAMVVPRKIYETLGGFDTRITSWGEDWEMWVRIAAHYPVWYEVEPLAIYREHQSSLSGRSMRSGQNIRDIRLAVEICRQYVPSDYKIIWPERALENWGRYALMTADRFMNRGDLEGACAQIREALKCSRTFRLYRNVIRMGLKFVSIWLRRKVPLVDRGCYLGL